MRPGVVLPATGRANTGKVEFTADQLRNREVLRWAALFISLPSTQGLRSGRFMAEPKPKPKLEIPDITLFLGLILLLVGLGFAVSWPVALTVTGAVLIGLSIWLLEPRSSSKDKV